ncbi:hypothetical protein CH341_24395 [Rhodoplanes roseus]|uniref:Uncharacterized protein n=1 Tax=Rhodoplanes roseus TaxID=29409 RepID=A0A327KNY1_9BRAD|nr:hypothetical protein CH341_24395 [Rhodoplanes roseus]
MAQQRLRTVGVARVNFGCQEKQARQVGLRDRPPTSASIVSIVGRPRPQLTGGVPADGARFHVLQWERDDRIWAALCRRALGLPPIVNVAAGTVPGDSDPPPSAA